MSEITASEVQEAARDPDLTTYDRVYILFEIMRRTNGGRRQLVAAATIIVGAGIMAFNLWSWNGVQIFAWTLTIALIIFVLLILPRPK